MRTTERARGFSLRASLSFDLFIGTGVVSFCHAVRGGWGRRQIAGRRRCERHARRLPGKSSNLLFDRAPETAIEHSLEEPRLAQKRRFAALAGIPADGARGGWVFLAAPLALGGDRPRAGGTARGARSQHLLAPPDYDFRPKVP